MIDSKTRRLRDAAQKVLRDIHQAQKAERPVVERVEREKRVAFVNQKADRGRKRDKGFLRWLHSQPCAVRQAQGLGCEGPIQACHIRTHKPGEMPTGLQRKPDDRRCTSMCAKHHAGQHAGNEMAFWSRYGLDPFETAERLFAAYEAQG